MAKIIAISNQKGGTGKTTTTINLGACLAERGKKVLLVDLDPQANLSRGLNVVLGEGEPGAYEFIMESCQPWEVIRGTDIQNLYLVPSHIDLAAAETALIGEIGREQQLRAVLGDIQDKFDYILIDTPPSLGLLMINALSSANQVIIPVQSQTFAVSGLKQLLETIGTVKAKINPYLTGWFILPTMVDYRRNEDKRILRDIRDQYGERVLSTVIRINARLLEAVGNGQAITQYDKNSVGAKEYSSCAEELLSLYEGVA
ncbi:Cobyrinic acid a,c-diamide synthase [Desulforamulus reducens MI-1]|uniref:Sporulation initiation inhibitor protein Soj n=1 Tax=Desulforamulus reducens (strain ATCC BAA-1160 / DSM 100696 / MI-1) TaxID=349161 RepID=A4J2X5_DESRM|nr:AAA family ATPase [Desulforamulus reducens]ABO49428.1 Cobyrinic acid a,c-diamide synthase [Desulforamulus reducens MI-1]